jgi:prepilin-type N-terminal cleavage/methylation domain-containing protein
LRQYRTSRGFTLIELLVVIAIIAILAAILFPVFARAKSQALKTQCLSNMNQISKAITMYADDNSDKTPMAWGPQGFDPWTYTWRERILPYTKSNEVLICPIPLAFHRPGKSRTDVKNPSHYGMNVYLAYFWNYKGWCKLSQVHHPTQTILVSENIDGDWAAEPWDNGSTGAEGQFYPYHSDGDTKGGVFIFCDTHAKFISVFETERDDFWLWKNKP